MRDLPHRHVLSDMHSYFKELELAANIDSISCQHWGSIHPKIQIPIFLNFLIFTFLLGSHRL